jgi:hypothetical protein
MIEIRDYPINLNAVFDWLKKENAGVGVMHGATLRSFPKTTVRKFACGTVEAEASMP